MGAGASSQPAASAEAAASKYERSEPMVAGQPSYARASIANGTIAVDPRRRAFTPAATAGAPPARVGRKKTRGERASFAAAAAALDVKAAARPAEAERALPLGGGMR